MSDQGFLSLADRLRMAGALVVKIFDRHNVYDKSVAENVGSTVKTREAPHEAHVVNSALLRSIRHHEWMLCRSLSQYTYPYAQCIHTRI